MFILLRIISLKASQTPTNMSRPYTIVEPHPNPSKTSRYMHTSRGGAGNVANASPASITHGPDAQGPPSRIFLNSSSSQSNKSRPYTSGRGGAGNIHQNSSERRLFSFDEELASQLQRDQHLAPVYHVGRGGAGNTAHTYIDGSTRSRKDSESVKSDKSTSSVESGADVATRSIKRGVQKGWGKVIGVGNYVTG